MATQNNINDRKSFDLLQARYPHIGAKIAALWGRPELNAYLDELLHDTRDGSRAGFPFEVTGAILDISERHHRDFPQHVFKASDIWSLNNRTY